MNDKLKNILKVLVSVVLIGYVIYSAGPQKILGQLKGVNLGLFSLAILISIFNVAISAKKWQILLKAKNEMKGYLETWKVYYIGMFFNAFLPTSIGGDVVKAHKMSKKSKKSIEAYSSVFMERFTGFIAVIVIAIISTTLTMGSLPSIVLGIIYLLFLPVILIAVILTFKEKKIGFLAFLTERLGGSFFGIVEKIEKFYQSVNQYRDKKEAVIKALFLSFIFQIILIMNKYLLALSLGMDINIYYFFVFIPITTVLLILPVSIRGIGLRELLYIYFLGQVGIESAQAVSFSFLGLLLVTFHSVTGGIIYTLEKIRR